ncbi:limbic system-associated membrane protein-like isoform X2 [Euwallacea fornicatus]|uniref:limbic system-associated membrane protein-like isoform X2 n=1 Tax=Euwallacea fornicatus TaxID=995702 RepID=UPI00338EF341
MKLVVILCILLGGLGVLYAAAVDKDVVDKKTKFDENVYGAIDEEDEDLQKDQNDYYSEIEKDDEDGHEGPEEAEGSNDVNVKLISKGQEFMQDIDTVVDLPCQTSSKNPVRLWYKDSILIYHDQINLENKQNYKLLDNGTLQVTITSAKDFGNYSCKLAVLTKTQPQVVHQVFGKISPNITHLFVDPNKKVFDSGASFTLTCQASGYPKPKIQWHKDNEKLGTEGESLTITNAKPSHAGNYRCFADNKVGKPDHKYIKISIIHAPIVLVDKYLINTDHGEDAELICEVKGYPTPVVLWQRNEQNIVSREPKIVLKRTDERNTLTIRNVTEEDFGKYACVAINSNGKETRTLNLVKTPAMRKFQKSHSPQKDIILQWRVESKQLISAHELQYRVKGESDWNTLVPEVEPSDNDVYLIKYTLKSLEPGIYETRARSKNHHGWSNYSDIIPFESESASLDTPAQQRTGEAVGESKTSSSTSLIPSLSLLVLLMIIHMRQ